MILYIAEKPSLARAIADVLPKPHRKQEGYIEVGNGDRVSWCLGHLLEQAEPDEYDPQFKSWREEHLPIIPEQWKLKPRSKTRKQLTVLRKLIKQADALVHAGDPDREGQLLVDEVINHLGASEQKKQATRRCLISDLNPKAVRKALSDLRSNREFIPLSTSALARSRADWLYGINMTRAYTIKGRGAGYNGVLSVGRVQTPVLGLVVQRDKSIKEFVSKPFYEVLARLQCESGETFDARWKPSENCRPYQDEEGRVLSKKLADNVVARITGKPAQVSSVEQKQKRQKPPLPFNLSVLQIEAAKRFGMSAKQVLDTCQTLYERHKLITYPRSDCRWLPEDHHAQGAKVAAAVAVNCESLTEFGPKLNLSLRSGAWNDKKVSAHHAIIPTEKQAAGSRLTADEQKLYELISRYYFAQFLPIYQYYDTRVEVIIEGGLFLASAHQTIEMGWKSILSERSEKHNHLPSLASGQLLHCEQGILEEKQTQPPKHYTDATLLAAMTGIARYVTAPEIRKVLKETDGLGTEATRAGIIELLFGRKFLSREGKAIRATQLGTALIDCLPASASTPDMTALWELSLNQISQQQESYSSFMSPMIVSLQQLIEGAREVSISADLKAISPAVKKGGYRKRRSGAASNVSKRSRGNTTRKSKAKAV